jgi:cell division protein FtsQ
MKLFVKILLIVLWIAIASGVVVMMGFANETHQSKPCRKLVCEIDYKGIDPLINGNELINSIIKRFGKPSDQTIGEINIEAISSFVRNNPYLENTDVVITIEGDILVRASQCVPLVRFLASDGQWYYLDNKGRIMPVDYKYPCKALIATGLINIPLKAGRNIYSINDSKNLREKLQPLYDIHLLAGLITSNPLLNALIEQVYITSKGKIQLVTKAGSHIVYLGSSENAAEKLENLTLFYKQGLVKTGWHKYARLNLEYKNQIVCTK